MTRDQIPLKDRSTCASSVSVNIHLAHPWHVQSESMCAPYTKRKFSIDTYVWSYVYTNIVNGFTCVIDR